MKKRSRRLKGQFSLSNWLYLEIGEARGPDGG
jgi:hypothetical protein